MYNDGLFEHSFMNKKYSDPIGHYQKMIECGELKEDVMQAQVVAKLQLLHQGLEDKKLLTNKYFLEKIFSKSKNIKPLKGLYIYGGVGRGKSMLMDLFFDLAPVKDKRRVHFHAFMLEIHEFHITDVTDAMILGRLFGALWERNVTLVLTSNRSPDDLYKNGLNRGLFLPTIQIIKEKLDIEALNGSTDYRLERMKGMEVYHHPLGDIATKALSNSFWRLTDHEVGDRSEVGSDNIEVQGRVLHIPLSSRGVAVVSFKKMCAAALGSADYLALAWKYHTLIMVGIPELGPENRNEAKRFVTFIDALYENNVKFLCCAEVSPEKLYAEGHSHFEFQRTVSRLMEMQSKEYLAKGHAV